MEKTQSNKGFVFDLKYYVFTPTATQNGMQSLNLIFCNPQSFIINSISFFVNLCSSLVPNLSKASVFIVYKLVFLYEEMGIFCTFNPRNSRNKDNLAKG